jgi:hypothetical protein
MRAGLDSSGLIFQLLKQSPAGAQEQGAYVYKNLGRFGIRIGENSSGTRTLIYRPSDDSIALRVDDFQVPDNDPVSSGVYSIVDFMPGAIAESGQVFLTEYLDAFRKHDFDLGPAVVQLVSFSDAVSSGRVVLKFSYPKEIRIGEPFSVDCRDRGGYLARLLPESPDSPDRGSGIGAPAPELSEGNKRRLCGALVSTEYKSVEQRRP